MGYSKGRPQREVHRLTCLSKKDRNISNMQPNRTPTRTQGTTTKATQQVQGKK